MVMKCFIVFGATIALAAAQRRAVQENYGPPAPYQFAYASEDKEGSSSREEYIDASGRITGKYTLNLADGELEQLLTTPAGRGSMQTSTRTSLESSRRTQLT